jgi:hypothetical protein
MEHSSVPAVVDRSLFALDPFPRLCWHPNACGGEKIVISSLEVHDLRALENDPFLPLVSLSARFRSLSSSQPEPHRLSSTELVRQLTFELVLGTAGAMGRQAKLHLLLKVALASSPAE